MNLNSQGTIIKTMRKRAGLTMRQMAAQAGITITQLARVEADTDYDVCHKQAVLRVLRRLQDDTPADAAS